MTCHMKMSEVLIWTQNVLANCPYFFQTPESIELDQRFLSCHNPTPLALAKLAAQLVNRKLTPRVHDINTHQATEFTHANGKITVVRNVKVKLGEGEWWR